MSIKKGVLVASVVAATILAGGCASTKSGCSTGCDVPPPPPSTTTVGGCTANSAFTTTSTTVATPTQQAVMVKDHSACKGCSTTKTSGCSTAASGCNTKCATAASGCSGASGCNAKAVNQVHTSMHGDPYQSSNTMHNSGSANQTSMLGASASSNPQHIHTSMHGDPYMSSAPAPQQPAKPYQQGTSPHDPVRAAQTLDNTAGTTGSDNSGGSTDSSSY